MKLSYAQRLEDYHLELMFADCATGFYIDVGGGHPIADNVSYWFYLKGWRGLVVEPQAKLADLYAHIRPRDITECTLVGSREGEVEFHVVDRLHGFSTTVESNAKTAASMGTGYATERLPMRRLQSLTTQHGIARVDFLKIDVEGAELDALRGASYTMRTCKPAMILAIHPEPIREKGDSVEAIFHFIREHRYTARLQGKVVALNDIVHIRDLFDLHLLPE